MLPHPHAQNALIVFAKPPIPGEVKTRLVERFTKEEAAALYEAFLRDAFAQYTRLDVHVRLYVAGPIDAWPPALVPDEVTLHKQRGDGLGDRMAYAFEETFSAGFERVVIVGTDLPTLPSKHVEEAFEALIAREAVPIGPSDDGGYYLLGMRTLYRGVFEEMTYSHAQVFEETVARIDQAGARPVALSAWYDVDTPADVERLAADLHADGAAAPHTRRCLAALAERYPALSI